MVDSFLSRFDPHPAEANRKCEDLWRRLVSYFQYHFVPDPEDCAQEVFHRIIENLSKIGPSQEDVIRFSFGVAKNIARERGREPESFELPVEAAAKDPDPLDQAAANERDKAVRECLESLGPSDEELVEDWYLDGRKAHAETAARLNLSPNALRLRVFRVKNRFVECLRKRGIS